MPVCSRRQNERGSWRGRKNEWNYWRFNWRDLKKMGI